MSNISSTVTTNIDRKIKIFIEALSEQLAIEKDELYEIFNNLVETGSEDEVDVLDEELSDSSEEKEVVVETKPKKKEKKKEEEKLNEEKGKCDYLFTKGAKKGQKCSVIVDGCRFCKKHLAQEKIQPEKKVEVEVEVEVKEVPVALKQAPTKGKCEYVITKGKNEGQKCNVSTEGSKFCKKHCKEETKSTEDKKQPKKESPAKKNSKTKKADDEQKDKETINRLVDTTQKSEKSEKIVKKAEPVLSLSRNRFGNFEMPETGFVFDPKTRQVVGTQNENGNIDDLTVEDIALCKEFGFNNVKIPEKLKSNVSDSEEVEDEELEDEELEEEDDDEEEDEDEEEDGEDD